MKIKKVVGCEIPLFDRSVMAVVGCSESEAITLFTKFAEQHNAGEIPFELTGARAFCTTTCGDCYIWVGNENKPSMFMHEMVHAAFQLCDLIYTQPDQEIIARLVEYMKIHLMDEIYCDEEENQDPAEPQQHEPGYGFLAKNAASIEYYTMKCSECGHMRPIISEGCITTGWCPKCGGREKIVKPGVMEPNEPVHATPASEEKQGEIGLWRNYTIPNADEES